MTHATVDRNAVLSRLERTVERTTGSSVSEIRNRTLEAQRAHVERKHKAPMKFVTSFPAIGRGNVMRERTKSRNQINAMVDHALR